MSFVVRYRPLVSVEIQDHEEQDPISAFAFEPTAGCRRSLADRRLVFRPGPHGFRLFYQTNPQAPDPLLGRIGERVRLSFALRLVAPGFFERYGPDLTGPAGPCLYLDNLTPSGSIQAKKPLTTSSFVEAEDSVRVHPVRFVAREKVGSGSAPTEFQVRDRFDPTRTVLTAKVESAGESAWARIDLSDEPGGPYKLITDAAGATGRPIYVDDDLARTRALGVVDIHWETAQDQAPQGGVPYVIRFKKR